MFCRLHCQCVNDAIYTTQTPVNTCLLHVWNIRSVEHQDYISFWHDVGAKSRVAEHPLFSSPAGNGVLGNWLPVGLTFMNPQSQLNTIAHE